MPPVIALSHVTRRYGAVTAVDDLSLEVAPGEVLGLLGPNGAGKSTTLYMLAGLVHPSAGTISLFGKELRRHWIEVAGRMGVMVERPVFLDYLPVRKTLAFHARLSRRPLNVDRILDLVGLLHLRDVRAGALSLGQRQRLGLAQAMLTEPELLLLDEPTTGLDVEASQEVLQLLRRLAEEAGVTIVFSSHLLHEVEALCDRVAVMNNGRLSACDRVETLLSYDQTQVEVLLEGAESAGRRLVEQPWVRDVEVRGSRLNVRLTEPNVPQLVGFLVNAGYPVSGVLPKRRTLREYFLKVMNRT
jgi:ABC-2 type transport system ATP-binding protein